MTESSRPAATLTVSRGPGVGRGFEIGAAPVTIGRQAQCDIQIEDTWMSRRHARIAWTGTEYIVEDLDSTNGTFVHGERVVGPHALRTGDRLQLGDEVELVFEARASAPSDAEPALPGAAASRSYAPRAEPVSVQEESSTKRRSTRVWAPVLLGLFLIIVIGVGVYFLLSDNGQQGVLTPTAQAAVPEPTTAASAATPTPPPVAAQADATFVGPMTISSRGENASAEGGEIEFTTSADGAELVSMSYSFVEGKCTYVSGSSTTTVTGSSKATLFFNEPVPIANGRFTVDFMGVRAKGALTSPSEAHGEISIDEEQTTMSPSYQKFVCHYGTWTWTASVE